MKLVLYDCYCTSNTTLGGDWVYESKDVTINRSENKLYFIGNGYRMRLTYGDETMAQEALEATIKGLETVDSQGKLIPIFKVPSYDEDNDCLDYH